MPIGICQGSIQVAEISADSDLEGIVCRLADVTDVGDATDAVKWARWVSGCSASDRQVGRNRAAYRLTIDRSGIAGRSRPRDAAAIIGRYRLSRGVRVERWRQRLQLVIFRPNGQFSAKAANIRDLQDRVARQFPLHSEIVLLNVGPDGMDGNGGQAERKLQPRSSDLVVRR